MNKRLTCKTGAGTAYFKVDKAVMNDQIARAAFYQEVCDKLADFEDRFEWVNVKDQLPEILRKAAYKFKYLSGVMKADYVRGINLPTIHFMTSTVGLAKRLKV